MSGSMKVEQEHPLAPVDQIEDGPEKPDEDADKKEEMSKDKSDKNGNKPVSSDNKGIKTDENGSADSHGKEILHKSKKQGDSNRQKKKMSGSLILHVESANPTIEVEEQGRQSSQEKREHENGINPSVDHQNNVDSKDRKNETSSDKSTEKNDTDGKTIDIDDETIDGEAIISVEGKDEPDAVSIFSLYMKHDARYYFQHPYSRLFVAYFVTFCNFLIYAEDPVAHSLKECNIPLIGNDFAFVCTRYPPNAWSLLKVLLWLTAMIVGMFLGKLLIHKLLLTRVLKLEMFSQCQGSWMIMFMFVLITLFIFSWIFNGFLMIGGSATEDYRISDLMGLSNSIFMKMAATGTWCGDFFTAWMVTDMMLQEKLYPHWAQPVRKWWNRKLNRVILFWIVVLVTSFVVLFVIATDYIQWDKLNRDLLPSNELSRSFLASFILVMDLLIVMQDWDFPHFMSNIDIKLPGLNTAHINFKIPKCLRKDHWHVQITGKWFNYGILFLVMILDLNMWKNQLFYSPYDFGQYVDGEGKIHTVLDDYSLKNFNESQFTYAFRNSTISDITNLSYVSGDSVMNSRYYNISLSIKGVAFIPSLVGFLVFGLLIWFFGRLKPSKEDPYAGRLVKRPKKAKFSFRKFGSSFKARVNFRKRVQAVPKLLKFTKRGNSAMRRNSERLKNQDDSRGFPENWEP